MSTNGMIPGNVLDCFGIGYVLQDKETTTDEVMIYCPLLFPEGDGELAATTEQKDVTINSPTGDTSSSSGLKSNGIMMKWLPFNTNRITSPDVRKGSKVVVYKFKGQDKYRWMYFGMDGTLRLETVITAYSASPNTNADSPFNTDNYYIFIVSTHTGKIQLLTGQGNGEACAYSITLDTKRGGFTFADTEDNKLILSSKARTWSLSNADKSVIGIDKKKIIISCEDQLLMKGTEKIVMSAKVIDMKAGNSINLEAGQSYNLAAPKIYMKGEMTHDGNLTRNGNTTLKGNITQTGNMTTSGSIGAAGDVTGAGVSVSGHKHRAQGENAITTSPI